MVLNQIENKLISGIHKFIFIDKETQMFLDRYRHYDVLNAIVIAADYIFPGITKECIWEDRDKYPYKEIISNIGELLFNEISCLVNNVILKVGVTSILNIYYFNNVILLTINIGDP